MKLQKFLFAILISVILGCSEKNNEVIISIKNKGEIPKEIFYTIPVNGICNWHFQGSVKPDSLGNTLISVTINTPAFIQLLLLDSPVGLEDSPAIIVEPGRHYELIIDCNSKEKVFEIESNLRLAQDCYNSFSKINPRSCLFSFNRDISNISGIKQDLNKKKQNEVSKINELFKNGDISEDIFELLKQDREVYYSTAQSTLASINNLNFRRKGVTVPDSIFDTWGEAALSVPLTNPKVLRNTFIYDYLDMHFWYKLYTTLNVEDFIKIRNDFRKKDLGHTYTIDIAKGFFSGDILEFYIAGYIFFYSNLKHEKEFISIMEQFKVNYPNSEYIKYLESPINKIREYHK